MRLLAYIPARSGSKSVPGKNIKPIKNIPLLAFSVWAAQQAGVFDDILVSTDDPAYLETVEPLGISGDYLRPSELAEDASPTIDGMHHALDWFEAQGKEFDAVMILQPTAPFRTPAHIREAVWLLEANPKATCVTGIVQMGDTHPARLKRLVEEKWLEDFCEHAIEPEPSRRQDLTPPAYLRNGTIYLTRTRTIREDNLIRGDKVIGMEMHDANSVNVDTDLDFLVAEASLSYDAYREHLSCFDELIADFGTPA